MLQALPSALLGLARLPTAASSYLLLFVFSLFALTKEHQTIHKRGSLRASVSLVKTFLIASCPRAFHSRWKYQNSVSPLQETQVQQIREVYDRMHKEEVGPVRKLQCTSPFSKIDARTLQIFYL